MKKTSLLFASLIIFMIASCTKDGATGPAGPAGPQGNANVKTVIFSNQSWTYSSADMAYEIALPVADITTAIVQKGSINVYMSSDGGTSYIAVPLSLGTKTITYGYSVGSVDIEAVGYSSSPNPATFKINIIAGQ